MPLEGRRLPLLAQMREGFPWSQELPQIPKLWKQELFDIERRQITLIFVPWWRRQCTKNP
jgi:hypothetical protein